MPTTFGGVKVRTTLCLFLAGFYALSICNAQISLPHPQGFHPPKVTWPTANDIKREATNAGKTAKEAWDKVVNLNPPTASEEMWGEAGKYAYHAAAAIMAKRSPTGVPLSPEMRACYRPFYGALVENLTLHYGTTGLDEWAASRFKISLTGSESDAQTYGLDVYIKQEKPAAIRKSLLHLLAHEFVHSEQYANHGHSLTNFGYHYFKNFKKANQSYENNSWEVEAENKAKAISDFVAARYSQCRRAGFRTFNNHYMCADGGGGASIIANRREKKEWESFTIIDLNGGNLMSGDLINIATHHGHYVRAVDGGGKNVVADRDRSDTHEAFVITKHNGNGEIKHGDVVSIRAFNGKYFVAEGGGGGVVNANRPSVGDWEKFTYISP